MSRVLVVGDTHGNLGFWRRVVIPVAVRQRTRVILQLGDFGLWPGIDGLKYIERLSEALVDARREVVWIDGNHDWHDALHKVYIKRHDQWAEIRPGILHAPRGCRFTEDRVRFLACGGAHSIDRHRRTPGVSWWPQETISDLDVRRCRAAGKAEVLLSHDCPAGIPVEGEHGAAKACVETDINRARLRQVVRSCQPKLVLHGHWHKYHDTDAGDYRVVGLAHDGGDTPSMAVLELPSLALHVLPSHRSGDVGYVSPDPPVGGQAALAL